MLRSTRESPFCKRRCETSNYTGDSKRGRCDDHQDLCVQNNENCNSGLEEGSSTEQLHKCVVRQLECEVKTANEIILKLKTNLLHLIADNNMLAGRCTLRNEGEEVENENLDLSVICKVKDDAIASLKSENTNFRQQCEDLKKEMSEVEKQYQFERKRNLELVKENLKCNDELKKKNLQLKKCNDEVNDKKPEPLQQENQMKMENLILKICNEGLNRMITELETVNLKLKCDNVVAEMLKTEIGNVKQKCRSLNFELEGVRFENEKNSSAMDGLKANLKSHVDILEKLQPLNHKLETKIKNLEMENKNCKKKLQKLKGVFYKTDDSTPNPIETNNVYDKDGVEDECVLEDDINEEENGAKVEIYRNSGVFCSKTDWEMLKSITEVNAFCRKLTESIFSRDELLSSTVKRRSTFKYKRLPLDQVKVSAFVNCILEKFPTYSKSEIHHKVSKQLFELRRKLKRQSCSTSVSNA